MRCPEIRHDDDGNWAAPGGGMDLRESIVDIAARETWEKTGSTDEVSGLVGIYTNPRHVIRYNGQRRNRRPRLTVPVPAR